MLKQFIVLSLMFNSVVLTTALAQWQLTGNATTDTSINFIGTTDNTGLKIKTNNTDRLWIGTNGRVGINTVNPAFNLEVNNNNAVTMGIRSNTAGATVSMDRGLATANAAFAYKSQGITLWNSGILGNDNFTIRNAASGNNVLMITPSNNVGIGTGNPLVKLEVNGNTKTTGFESVNDVVINAIKIGRGGGNLYGNTIMGQNCLINNTTGDENTAMGYEALSSNTLGFSNTAVGFYALRANTEGHSNVAVGRFALSGNATGQYNVGMGFEALSGNFKGNSNTAVGHQALHSNDSNNNTAFGYSALFSNYGGDNTAVGANALMSNQIGSGNVALGTNTLITGSHGSHNVAIGKNADVLYYDLDSTVTIGTNAKAGVKNAIVLGDTSNALIGIGTAYPIARLHVKSSSTQSFTNLLLDQSNENASARLSFKNSAQHTYRRWDISATLDTSLANEKLTFSTYTMGTLVTINGYGNVGIGNSNPKAGLHVEKNTGVVAIGTFNNSETLNVTGAGTRLLWWPKKAAFRTGRLLPDAIVPGDETAYWNEDSIGSYSFASGFNVKASGAYSSSFGNFTDATGANSLAAGKFTTASGNGSVAMGLETDASGNYSMAVNNYNVAKGKSAFAAGNSNRAEGDNTATFGSNNAAEGDQSFASGIYNATRGENSSVFGSNNIAMGFSSFVVGVFNDTIDGDPNNINDSTPLFIVGSGDNNYTRKNAFAVYKDTKVKIGRHFFKDVSSVGMAVKGDLISNTDGLWYLGAPSNRWGQIYAVFGTINTSDARDKENINTLAYGTDALMKLKPVSYTWKNFPEHGTKLGLLAQDLQKVIPEVVEDKEWIEGENGKRKAVPAEKLGVFYSDLIPVLIKGFQEQHERIEKSEKHNDELLKTIQSLTEKMNQLENDLSNCCTYQQKSGDVPTNGINNSDVAFLEQNQPNPFSHNTIIRFYLPSKYHQAQIVITDSNGNTVKTITVNGSGAGSVQINANEIASGIYNYSLEAGDLIITRKMILTK